MSDDIGTDISPDGDEYFYLRMAFPEEEIAAAFQQWYDQQGRILFEQWHKCMLYNVVEEAAGATKQ